MDNEKLENQEEENLEENDEGLDIEISDDDLNFDDNSLDILEEKESENSEEMSPALEKYPIVVIDDDRWIQRIFNQYLKNWGFEYVPATNSFEGLDVAIKSKPLLIFLDIIMPDVTGDITLKFIRGIEELKRTPVVIISGNLNKDVLKSTYKDGATGFITKPFTKEILYQKIKDVLDPKIYKRMVNDGLIDPKALKPSSLKS